MPADAAAAAPANRWRHGQTDRSRQHELQRAAAGEHRHHRVHRCRVLNGSAGKDKIIGSAQKDTINGGGDNDGLAGNGGDDTIDGGDGNDTIIGGAGADTLVGGFGDDVFKIGAGDLAAGESIEGGFGLDTLRLISAGIVQTATADFGSVEIIDFVSGNAQFRLQVNTNPPPDGDGSGLSYGITTVDGGTGTDQLVVTGRLVDLGAVSFTNWSATDIVTLNGTTAGDSIAGSQRADRIFGLGSDDVLSGGGGADLIVGGAGRDRMTGGSERDIFDFNNKSETPAFVAGVFSADFITDFVDTAAVDTPQDDIIDLSGIDADEALAGNQAFFLDDGDGVSEAGEITIGARMNAQGAPVTVLMGHTNGGQSPDFAIEFDRVVNTLGADDFVL
jgi:Ca2+-binding RTX toxin-like protein